MFLTEQNPNFGHCMIFFIFFKWLEVKVEVKKRGAVHRQNISTTIGEFDM